MVCINSLIQIHIYFSKVKGKKKKKEYILQVTENTDLGRDFNFISNASWVYDWIFTFHGHRET